MDALDRSLTLIRAEDLIKPPERAFENALQAALKTPCLKVSSRIVAGKGQKGASFLHAHSYL